MHNEMGFGKKYRENDRKKNEKGSVFKFIIAVFAFI